MPFFDEPLRQTDPDDSALLNDTVSEVLLNETAGHSIDIEDLADRAKQIFTGIDKDQDGFMSRTELGRAVEEEALSNSRKQNDIVFGIRKFGTEEGFNLIDSDSNGFLTPAELKSAFDRANRFSQSISRKYPGSLLQEHVELARDGVRYLLDNVELIEEASNDEYGDENDGVTIDDVQSHISDISDNDSKELDKLNVSLKKVIDLTTSESQRP